MQFTIENKPEGSALTLIPETLEEMTDLEGFLEGFRKARMKSELSEDKKSKSYTISYDITK